MSAPHSSDKHDRLADTVGDATCLEPETLENGATLTKGVSQADWASADDTVEQPFEAADHSPVSPTKPVEATLFDTSNALAHGATVIVARQADNRNVTPLDAGEPVLNPATVEHSVIEAEAHNANVTPPGVPASAEVDLAGKPLASTIGFNGGHPTGPSPNSETVSTPPQGQAPRTENRYRLIDNIAKGGLGKIWRAEDTAFHREIGFKELLPLALTTKGVVERFLEEAQVTGQLEHPGIVPVYDVGFQQDGTPFYAMKLVKGGHQGAGDHSTACAAAR